MKLTDEIKIPLVNADSKKDYVFDLHIAQKHNNRVFDKFRQDLTNFIKQTQRNSFWVKTTDQSGTTLHDSDLISVNKSSQIYTITTDYKKEFEGALCYDDDGVLANDEIKISFELNTDLTENKQKIKIEFVNPITSNFRIILL